jgi:hypothetical protein
LLLVIEDPSLSVIAVKGCPKELLPLGARIITTGDDDSL